MTGHFDLVAAVQLEISERQTDESLQRNRGIFNMCCDHQKESRKYT